MVTPIDPKVEIELDGTWTDITSYVRYDGRISINRGRGDEDSELPPSTASFKLDNSDGRFSPRNPRSPYYGAIGRNTPVRISLPYGETYLRIRDLRQAYTTAGYSLVSCPDASALGITGDLDVRIDLTALSWRTGYCDLASKYLVTGDQRSWYAYFSDGYVGFGWSPDGTLASRITLTSTARVPATPGRLALRATLDVDNGSGGYAVTFYTAPTISGSWTQLGDPVTGSGTTSVYDSTAPVKVGDLDDINGEGVDGYYHAFELRSGIGGTVVANPNFAIQTSGAASFSDTASSPNTWTVSDEAYLSDRVYRFTGEISSWPQRWDPTGSDIWVEIEASGITRRLQQGADPLQSALRRQLSTASTDIVAYWPMEDEGADRFTSAVDGSRPLVLRSGTACDPAANNDFVGSAPLPTFSTGVYRASVPGYSTSAGQTQLRFLLAIPSSGLTATSLLAQLSCTGSARRWDVWWSVGDNLIHTSTYDSDGVRIDTQTTGLDPRGKLLRVSLELTQNGSNIDYEVVWLEQGERVGFFNSYTLTSNTVGRVYAVSVGGEDGQDLGGTTIGHVSLSNQITSIHDAAPQFNAYGAYGDGWYLGENPITRMIRLSEENDAGQMEVTSFDLLGNDTTMGAQGVKTYLELLRECVETDLGLLYEPRDRLGLGYRSRLALYNQAPKLALSYSGHELADSLNPVDDDQRVRNDVTITRDRGSSHRAVLESGPLSVNAPPDGVGRYADAITLVLGTDDQLADQAGWRLHLGTVDEARYPQIKLNLRHPTFDGDAAMRLAALLTDLGDRITISGVPTWLPPDDISLLVQGYSEVFDSFEHEVTFNCSPESPWHVGQVDTEGYDRLDTAGSSLAAAATSSATSLSVSVTAGPLWTTASANLPFDIFVAGERMTVTAVSGTSSPQTFTVTRSVNGVTKAQASGAAVTIAEPVYVAL